MPGKNFSIMGDSISTFRGVTPPGNRWYYDSQDTNGTGVSDPSETWWAKVVEHFGGRLVSNASFSGSMVQGWGFPAGSSRRRAEQLVGADGQRPDSVLVYMGINDYGWGSPEAQAVGESCASAANYDVDGICIEECPDIDADGEGGDSQVDPILYEGHESGECASPEAVVEFREAYVDMLENIQDVAPDAEIVCITLSPSRVKGMPGEFCYRIRGHELDSYNKAIKEAADAVGAKVADVRSLGLDYHSSDGTHPTAEGMDELARMVLASLGEVGLLDAYPEGMESSRGPRSGIVAGQPGSPVSDEGWSCMVFDYAAE